ncbi:class I SAM-dependent methyltransferase [Hydrogenimonas sp.]
MSEFDRTKWQKKYEEQPQLLTREEPAIFVRRYAPEGEGKRAVDLACGGGRNALWLARRGYEVDALDISETAIEALKKRSEGLPVHPRVVDLDRYQPPKGRYDLAIMVNFLDRDLLRRAADALGPGGLCIVETYMKHPENEKPGNPDFLLEPGELKRLFAEGYEILGYEEFWNEPSELYRMRKQGIAARKRRDG